MDDKLKKIFNACNPNLAAEENYYTDCREARGGDVLARKVRKRLDFLDNSYLRFLFTGHIGSGKSSELLHLVNILKEETNFFPIYVDVKDYINFENANLDEIFLAVAVELAESFYTELDIKLRNNYFEDKFAEIKDILLTKRKVSKLEVGFFGLGKAEIEEFKQNDEAKRKLYEAINQDNKSILEELNLFISRANLELIKGESAFNKIVVIVDSLEKIKKFGDNKEELNSQTELFIGNYTKLTGIETHIIYTVPLALYRSDQGPKLSQYYGNVMVLPMVKIFQRGKFNESYERGCLAFTEILKKRLGEDLFNEAFDKDALEFLIKYSGGNLRNLMQFIQDSVISTEDLPINFQVARKSIQSLVRLYSGSIKEWYWAKLADLEKSTDQQIDNGDEDFWAMLENLTVMEYVNGDDTNNLDDIWYAVNPVVREIGKFRAALEQSKTIKP
jgi:energy-coupling factor transporter ATP-binding protein EcfA2